MVMADNMPKTWATVFVLKPIAVEVWEINGGREFLVAAIRGNIAGPLFHSCFCGGFGVNLLQDGDGVGAGVVVIGF